MMNSVSDFGRDGYILLRSLLKEPALSLSYGYARKVAAVGAMQEDDMVEGAQCLYGDVAMEGLLVEVLPDVERHSLTRFSTPVSLAQPYLHSYHQPPSPNEPHLTRL